MASMRELLDADWARLAKLMGRTDTRRRIGSSFSARFAPVVLLRMAHALTANGWPRLADCFRFLNMVIFGIQAASEQRIGPGLMLPHTHGTVLGAASIGRNVTIFHQVTLGAREADYGYDLSRRPVIEDDVTISAGAKVLGGITLGAGCVVGANAVVLENVPAGMLAVGVPARVIAPAAHRASGPEKHHAAVDPSA
jgi:serine O-acetyltransferase